jgi:hypothetical protein
MRRPVNDRVPETCSVPAGKVASTPRAVAAAESPLPPAVVGRQNAEPVR